MGTKTTKITSEELTALAYTLVPRDGKWWIVNPIERAAARIEALESLLKRLADKWDSGMPNFETDKIEFPFGEAAEIDELAGKARELLSETEE